MPEERLHDPEVGSPLDHVGGEGMPKAVRREGIVEPRAYRHPPHQGEHRLAAQAGASRRQENLASSRVAEKLRTLDLEVAREGGAGRASERHEPLLVALPTDADRPLPGEELFDGQSGRLAHPDARAVEHLEDRTVAQRSRAAIGGREQSLDLRATEGRRQSTRLARLAEIGERALGEESLAHREAAEPPQRRQPSGLRPCTDPSAGLCRLERQHQFAGDSRRVGHAKGPGREARETSQVVAVSGRGVHRDADLAPQPGEVPVDELVDGERGPHGAAVAAPAPSVSAGSSSASARAARISSSRSLFRPDDSVT